MNALRVHVHIRGTVIRTFLLLAHIESRQRNDNRDWRFLAGWIGSSESVGIPDRRISRDKRESVSGSDETDIREERRPFEIFLSREA